MNSLRVCLTIDYVICDVPAAVEPANPVNAETKTNEYLNLYERCLFFFYKLILHH